MKRILVIRMGALGDLIMTTPALRALRTHFPEAELTYVTGVGLSPVLTGLPGVRKVLEFDKTFRGFCALVPQLSAERFDLVVNLQPSIKTHLISFFSRGSRQLTYKRDHAFHAVLNTLQTLTPLGITPESCSLHTEFFVPEEAHQHVDQLLTKQGILPDQPLVLITPSATASARQWPMENLVAFLDLAMEQHPHWQLAFFGGKGDQARAELALGRVKSPERLGSFIGQTTLKESGALLMRADVLVTMDTGPMHLAAAVGTPLVVLFGATSPLRTGPAPPPPHASKYRTPLNLVGDTSLPCVPCHARTCARGDLACLTRLDAERVLRALEEQLA